MMAARDIPDVGRFAAVADPQGAAFAVYKGKNPYPPEPERPPVGAFCWEELHTNDPVAAAKFYSAAFGYTVDEVDMGPAGTYRVLKRGDTQTAGIMKTMPGAPPHPHWRVRGGQERRRIDEERQRARGADPRAADRHPEDGALRHRGRPDERGDRAVRRRDVERDASAEL
jgi:predicted enzyme related to lactoylglutathione lyase